MVGSGEGGEGSGDVRWYCVRVVGDWIVSLSSLSSH